MEDEADEDKGLEPAELEELRLMLERVNEDLDASEKSHAALESAVATTSRASAAALLDARSSFSIHLESSLAASRDDAASDHAALVAELAETTKTLGARARETSIAILSYDDELRSVAAALEDVKARVGPERDYQIACSRWPVRASVDFIKDVDDDKRRLARRCATVVLNARENARERRMKRYGETFGEVSAFIATSRENQTRRMIETAARVEQVHRRIVGKGGWEGAANG